MAAKPSQATKMYYGEKALGEITSFNPKTFCPTEPKPSSLLFPEDDELIYQKYWQPFPHESELEIKVKEIYDELYKQLISGEQSELSVSIPGGTKWGDYPDWVWWTPKPENEQYYRALGIGREITIINKYYFPRVAVEQFKCIDGEYFINFLISSEAQHSTIEI